LEEELMAKITGWTGNLLRVNLTTGNIKTDSMKFLRELKLLTKQTK